MNAHLLNQIDDLLKQNQKPKRYQHILGVEKTALSIGTKYNLDPLKLSLSAKLHDYAKHLSIKELEDYCIQNNIEMDDFEINNHGLLHAKVGRNIALKEFNINDLEILNSISSHTTGRANMSIYEEVIFVSDYCDPNRGLEDCKKILEIAVENIKEAVFKVVSSKLAYVIKCKGLIHPRSLEVYNAYLTQIKCTK